MGDKGNVTENQCTEGQLETKITKLEEEHATNQAELAIHLKQKENNAGNLKLDAKTAKKVRDSREKAWDSMVSALGISQKVISSTRRKESIRSIVNLFYLLVIVGCELDLYGFMMAYSTYWYMRYMVVNILLCVAPFGYLISIGMYMKYSKKEESDEDENDGGNEDEDSGDEVDQILEVNKKSQQPTNQDTAPRRKSYNFSAADLPEMKPQRQPIELKYYHFLPVFRYYLVIKDKNHADVEGIFRVNSLSSFTLGITQIICIIFQLFVAKEEMTIFVKINIGSQIINWVITILYFMTPISDMMGASIEIDALTANSKDGLRKYKESYMELTRIGAYKGDMSEAESFEKILDREIKFTGGTKDVDLSAYPMELKFRALRLLREISINGYAEI